MRTIMLCLNKLGIGGVETAVYNQTIQLVKRNFKVVVVANDGIYREKFEKAGAIFVNYEFEVKNRFDIKKITEIAKIIKDYKIEQVHIHQFDCINVVFPACILCNTPYVAYAHTGILGVYDWFENSYPGYDIIFKLYFECSEKIVAITKQAKQENMEKYNIKEDKYLVINNSIDFEQVSKINKNETEKIEKLLIVSRLSKEKIISIKNAILLFEAYLENNANAKLTIVGDGECREEVMELIKKYGNSIEMLGQRNDIIDIISEYDLIIALDRCILEGIAMKKLCIISGYDGIKGLISPNNVKDFASTNFSGRGLENQDINKVIEVIKKLEKDKIRDIIERNYEYAYENLNASKNLYFIEDVSKIENNNTLEFMNTIIKLQNLYSDKIKKQEDDWKEWEKTKKWYEGQNELKQKEIDRLNIKLSNCIKELDSTYKSKAWRLVNKFKKFNKK